MRSLSPYQAGCGLLNETERMLISALTGHVRHRLWPTPGLSLSDKAVSRTLENKCFLLAPDFKYCGDDF